MTIVGNPGCWLETFCNNSKPDKPGILISVIIKSGLLEFRASKASEASLNVSILNKSWSSSKSNVNHNSQNTITIPRRVELNFQNATTTTDTTVTCAE